MAIELGDKNRDVFYLRGMASLQLEDFDGAVDSIDVAINLDKELSGSRCFSGKRTFSRFRRSDSLIDISNIREIRTKS